ncbi:hypothetical protein CsSME_00016015 [Camellia sinensis var. sinensis]
MSSMVTVSPETLAFRKTCEKQSYSLTIHYMGNKNGMVPFGSLIWIEDNRGHTVGNPIVVLPIIEEW